MVISSIKYIPLDVSHIDHLLVHPTLSVIYLLPFTLPLTKLAQKKYEMIEFLGSIKENNNSDWSKSVAKIAWNNNPSTIDIRNMNLSQDIMGKGISLTDEEVDNLVDLLLSEDYGTINAISEALEKKKKRFTIQNNNDDTIELKNKDDGVLKIIID